MSACAFDAANSDPTIADTRTSLCIPSPVPRKSCLRRVPRRAARLSLTRLGSLALVGLAGRELRGDPLGAASPLHVGSELRVAVADLRDEALAPRRHRDLVAVAL